MYRATVSNKTKVWVNKISGTCYLGNSLFSSSHSGEALEAMIEWINTQTDFKFVLVGLSDTLNRFTLQHQEKLDYRAARQKARLAGDKWVEKNMPIIRKLSKPYRFVRWDQWFLNNEEKINLYKNFYSNLYRNDPILRDAIHKDMNKFSLRRYNKTITEMPYEHISSSLDYLIEELAIYSIIFEKIGEATAVYPANELNMLKVIRNGSVQGIPNTIENSFFIKMHISELDNYQKQVA